MICRSITISAISLAVGLTASAGELTLPTSADSVQEAGGRVLGQFPESTEAGQGFVLGKQLAIAWPTDGNFVPTSGSIALEVEPMWNGDDGEAHTLFHLGDSKAHVTIFKTDGGSMRFVYKASPALYSACDISAAGWKPNQRHTVKANWLQVASGQLLLQLQVDDQRTLQSGATPLSGVPKEMFLGRRGAVAQPAEARFFSFHLSSEAGEWPYATGPKQPVTAQVDLARKHSFRKVHDFTTIWNNRENPLPFKVGDPEYRRFVDARFRMVRLVAFSESWLWGTEVTVDKDGQLQTDFTDFDRLLDVFTTAGAEPYIRLAYHTPDALVDPGIPKEKRHYALPSDLEKWDELMERIVRHVRFERNLPVRYWVTALNEADLTARRGLSEPITTYRLYERTSRLVKRLDPTARVGGPALAWSVEADGKPAEMLVDFVRYCRDRQVPLDFICFHGYRKAHPRDYERLLETIRSTVEKEWPEKAGKLEYFLDEWNLWNRDRRQDNEYGASYLAGALQYQRRADLTKSSIVSFNHFRPTEGEAEVLVEHVGPFQRSKASPVCFEVRPWTCGTESRKGFRLHPPNGDKNHSFARFEIDIPREGQTALQCATGVAGSYDRWTGCGFSVVVCYDGEETTLLDRFQRTKHWREHRLSLEPFAGETIEIEFRTNAGLNGEASGDWAVWGDPRVVTKNAQGKTQRDVALLERADRAVAGARREAWHFTYDEQAIAQFTGLPLIKGPVVTAPYFVWLMHSRLGANEAQVELPGKDGILDDDSGGLTATVDEDRVTLLLWHFDLVRLDPQSWKINLGNLPAALRSAKQLQVTEYRIDHDHNNPYTKYVEQKADSLNGAYNLETARLEPLRTEAIPVADGGLTLDVQLPNQSVSLLEIKAGR